VRTIEIFIEEKDGVATLRVTDNGCGMTPAVRARIFEPFFTTKDAQKGIGIGLATINNIIEKDLSGTIAIESQQGLGSTFTVAFPIQHAEIPGTDTSGHRPHTKRTIP
jgi:signal transduction histidine kinase